LAHKFEYIKRPWKYRKHIGEEASKPVSMTGPKAKEMQERILQIENMKKGVSLKGNLFKPIATVEYPGYPLNIPIDLFAYPERRLEFAAHFIKPGHGFPVHVHDYADEVFLVIKGKGKILIEEEEHDAELFDVFYMPAGTWHTAYNPEENDEDFGVYIVASPQLSQKMRSAGWELTENIWKYLGYSKTK